MNTQEEIYLLGLIGLRALAEYDLPEFKRSTDFSRRELDHQITSYLKKIHCPQCEELYEEMNTVIDVSESPLELSFLLQQIYSSSFRKAQYYSLMQSRRKSDNLGEVRGFQDDYSWQSKRRQPAVTEGCNPPPAPG